MKIEELQIEEILDSRKEKTIQITIKNKQGSFISSSPSGKSRGKFEAVPYRNKIQDDIEKIKEKEDALKQIEFTGFGDLIKLEILIKREIGANSLFALEASILKAIAGEKKKEVWQLINPGAKKIPIPIVNVIGGGKHSQGKKPDFQEFHIIPNSNSIQKNKEIVEKIYKEIGRKLRWKEKKLFLSKNDENAYNTELTNAEVLEFLSQFNVYKGIDVAASEFFKGGHYLYNNPIRTLSKEEQIKYIIELTKRFKILYIEDPLEQEDFDGFANILEEVKAMVVGDDLVVTNPKRLKRAVSYNSTNAVIVKPNQSGSLLEVKKFIELAKHTDIKTIMSHRSGETDDNILADLAFGFQTDFIKISLGRGRDSKWERLMGIERSLKR